MNRGNKYLITIKNKWTNSTRVVTVNHTENVQQVHKYAYYKHTTNLEDITSIVDYRKENVFTLRGGFRRTHSK